MGTYQVFSAGFCWILLVFCVFFCFLWVRLAWFNQAFLESQDFLSHRGSCFADQKKDKENRRNVLERT